MADLTKIKTSKIAAFINTGTSSTPTWSRIRKQSELKLKYDAETTEETYIDEDSKTTEIESYAVSFEGEHVAFIGDPVFEYLDGLRQARLVGEDAKTEIVIVNIYDSDSTTGAYSAEKNEATIQISEFGGEGGGGTASISYTCSFNGDPTYGTATVTDGELTFTESA
ncbi:MAG: hypothetical protein LUH82_01890 [Clostridiales bacterium]|nr:hypothetical protein [Clostridiales bacterium]